MTNDDPIRNMLAAGRQGRKLRATGELTGAGLDAFLHDLPEAGQEAAGADETDRTDDDSGQTDGDAETGSQEGETAGEPPLRRGPFLGQGQRGAAPPPSAATTFSAWVEAELARPRNVLWATVNGRR